MNELLKNKYVRQALKILPHAAIVISGMLIVFFCIDRVNKPMGFMTNEFHKVITFLLALISIGQSCFVITYQRRKERMEQNKRARAAQARRQGQQRPLQPPQRPAQPRRAPQPPADMQARRDMQQPRRPAAPRQPQRPPQAQG